jgi:hypothetical protein
MDERATVLALLRTHQSGAILSTLTAHIETIQGTLRRVVRPSSYGEGSTGGGKSTVVSLNRKGEP